MDLTSTDVEEKGAFEILDAQESDASCTSSWSELPVEVVANVLEVAEWNPWLARISRLACSTWRAAVSATWRDLGVSRTAKPGQQASWLRHWQGLHSLSFGSDASHTLQRHEFVALGLLTRLRHLSMENCCDPSLDDAALEPLSSLVSLSSLSIGCCTNATGAFLWNLWPLQELAFLSLEGSELVDLSGLEALPSLEALDLSFCAQLDQQLCHLSHLSSLRSLSLDCLPRLSSKGLAAVSLPESLTAVSLKEMAAVGIAIAALEAQLPRLAELCLEDTSLTDTAAAGLSRLVNLQRLDVSWNDLLTDAGVSSIGCLTGLRELSMALCSQVSNQGVQSCLRELRQLCILNIGDCQVSNRGLEAVEDLGNLTSLNLRNLFSVTAPLGISALTSLGSLSLHSCTGLEDLAWLKSLKSLALCSTDGLTEDSMAVLTELTALKDLNLKDCEWVTDTGMCDLSGLELWSLNLSRCCCLAPGVLRTWAGSPLAGSLRSLKLKGCHSVNDSIVEELLEGAGLFQLRKLDIRNCAEVTRAPKKECRLDGENGTVHVVCVCGTLKWRDGIHPPREIEKDYTLFIAVDDRLGIGTHGGFKKSEPFIRMRHR